MLHKVVDMHRNLWCTCSEAVGASAASKVTNLLPVFCFIIHYIDVVMTTVASQITSLTVVYSAVYSGADQIKHQSSASLAFVRGIHRGPVNSPHKGPVTRKMFAFDDVIMSSNTTTTWHILSFSVIIPRAHLPNIILCNKCIYRTSLE